MTILVNRLIFRLHWDHIFAATNKNNTIMKKVLSIVALSVSSLVMFSFLGSKPVSTYTVDVKQSKIEFAGAKKSGYHPGNFSLKGGSVSVENGKLTGGSFVIDLASLKITDEAGAQLEGHLKSKDFFDVEKFSTATFDIKSVKYVSESKANIDGELTIKGIKAKVSFTTSSAFSAVKDGEEISKFFGHATFTIDRTLLGLTAAPGHIDNDVQVTVYLFAGK